MRQQKLLWASSYDRGLNVLLRMWPDIKRKFPKATLDICYGWDLFDRVTIGNAERQEWKAKMVELMKQDGVKDQGRIGKEKLSKLRKECGILAYTSDFTEIFCMTAMECQKDGCVPITPDLAALKEFPQGRIIIEGDMYDDDTQEKYLKELTSLMGDAKKWHELSTAGKEQAKEFTWDKIAAGWTMAFSDDPFASSTSANQKIKISVVTPTIRKGWWNLMAHNLKSQTYQNFEWVIVDDYPTDRSEIAKKYAEQYKLDIKYVRGKKRNVKRTYALVNANNTGWQNATGELVVLLQDFVLLDPTGLEDLVTVYRHNPNSLIAPVDEYYAPSIKPDTESEDWFHGEVNVKGDFMRRNVRIQNKGFRFSQIAWEFEQNFGAIPKHIIDDLGGWYEFYDEGLGFDNTEFAYRALKKGYTIVLDETNIATCIDHWKALEGTVEHGLGRERSLSDPRFLFTIQMVDKGLLPLQRTQEIDDKIELLYTMPKEVPTEDAVKWIRENMDKIALEWIEKYEEIL